MEHGEDHVEKERNAKTPYQKWTLEQTKALLKGMWIHGRKWQVIINENPDIFYHKDRTQLKNKF